METNHINTNEYTTNTYHNVEFADQKNKRHRRSKNDTEGRNYVCPECQKSYLSIPALTNHRKSKHGYGLEGEKKGRGRPKKETISSNLIENAEEKFKGFFMCDKRKKADVVVVDSSSSNNNNNISSMNDSCICLYNIIHDHNNKKIGKCFKKLNVIKGEITKVQFTNTNKYLICLQYNSISVYDIESSLIINIIKSKQNISYKTFDLSPDSQYIGIACNNGMAIFTKIAEHSKEIKRYNHLNQCNCIKFNPVYAVITTADDIVVMMEPDFDNKRQLITN